MVFDNKPAGMWVEALNAGSDCWHKALGPIFPDDGQHVLSAIPERSGHAAKDRAVRFHGVAPEDVLKVKFAVRQR
jgi:hypothetical protein